MSQRHLIKKYANRKLYDTNESRYVTLSGISELVRAGDDIEVIDRETGRDITALILSQVVLSEEKRERADGLEDAGDGIQERGQALIDYVRRTLNAPAALVTNEVERRRGDLESIVDLAIQRLSVPSRRDFERLQRRVDELGRRLERVEGASGRGPSRGRSRRGAA